MYVSYESETCVHKINRLNCPEAKKKKIGQWVESVSSSPYLDQTLCPTLTFTAREHLKDSMSFSVIPQYLLGVSYLCS